MKIIAIVCFFLFFSCSEKQNVSQNLKEFKVLNQISSPLKHFDPQLSTDLASIIQLSKVYESLYETHPYNAPFGLLPNLAESLPEVSKDGLTYTIKVRKNIFFQDDPAFKGVKRKLFAEDFATAFKRIADPKLVSPHYSYWKKHILGLSDFYQQNKRNDKTDYKIRIPGIIILDDHTLQIKIIRRNNLFLNILSNIRTSPLPLEAIEFYKNDLSQVMIGTGPYILKKYVRKSQIIFERNSNYRDKYFPTTGDEKYASILKDYAGKKIPFIDIIKVNIINESQSAWLNFLKGKLDYLEVPKDNMGDTLTPTNSISPKMKKKGIELGFTSSLTNVYYFGVNQQSKTLQNKNLKKAIAHAFDFFKYNELFFNNTAELANSILPANIPGNTPAIKADYHQKNIPLAKKYLKKAGYENGVGLPEFVIIVKNTTLARQIAEFFQKEMLSINIKIKVETVTWGNLLERAQKGQFDFFYLAWFVGVPSGFSFFELLYGPNYPDSFNRMGFQNKEFDKLFDQALQMTPGKAQNILIKQMNLIAQDELPLIPLVHAKNLFVKQAWLKNYIPSEQYGGLEKYYDIDLALKTKLIEEF
jgi:oligopeptide transport system substrate-binding protein